ncbi:fused MFS/spermidine synthase [Herbaspirillum sp. GCM10030257]|uniref:fused MFS/spermidine synthase n=1 Tax=Herbaspirillum sp. GCM10030257 TaxID=3273393 RepID=UPI003623F8AE
MTRLLFAGTIFTSAFLLFLVQPLMSKQILPWFGGSAAVWATCMVFFQVVLLAGYAYADLTTRHLGPRRQVGLHIVLLLASAMLLPIVADPGLKPAGGDDPALRILLLLILTIGLPYFLLSTTGPLVQAWLTRSVVDARVYRFYALSNFASLLALVAYPFLIEPRATLLSQAMAWSVLYGMFAVLCALSGLMFARHATLRPLHHSTADDTHALPEAAAARTPTLGDHATWLALSAMGAWMLLAVTNHITQNIAAVPFLWLLPLTIYLLSFILCFESDRWYRRKLFLLPVTGALTLCAYGLQDGVLGFNIRTAIPLYATGLFFMCMFLHGELAMLRPAPRYLTRFYLMLSLGGALGGIAVGLLAPRLLPGYYELGIGLVIVALLGSWLFREQLLLMIGALLLALLCGSFFYKQVAAGRKDAHTLVRSFYGSLRTADTHHVNTIDNVRGLYHGSIRHGEQYLDPARRREPTSYYGRESGIGLAINNARRDARKIGLIGLGSGTLAAYGRAGDVYRFYEINPQVIELAQSEFSFLKDSQARIDTVLGDARLTLEKEAPQGFDVLAVDAFSGDAIPVHLLTREAMDVYLRHMRPDGIIAFHVTNRFLSLAPVVQQIAVAHGLKALLIHDDGMRTTRHKTDWVLVARDARTLDAEVYRKGSTLIPVIPGLRPWTDDFNNLFDVLK